MNKILVIGATVLACAATIVVGTSASADTSAATGRVTVFATEFTALNTWENPTGCTVLPVGAHVLINQTDKPVRIYGDPLCLMPGLTVRQGFGSHVTAGAGSFAVTE